MKICFVIIVLLIITMAFIIQKYADSTEHYKENLDREFAYIKKLMEEYYSLLNHQITYDSSIRIRHIQNILKSKGLEVDGRLY